MWAQQNINEAQDNKFNIEETNEEVYVAAAEAMLVGHTESQGGVFGLAGNITRSMKEVTSNVGKRLDRFVEPMNELPMIVSKHSKPKSMTKAFHGMNDSDVLHKYEDAKDLVNNDARALYAIHKEKAGAAYIIKRVGKDINGSKQHQDQLAYSYMHSGTKLSGKKHLDIEFHKVQGSYQTKHYNVIKLDAFHHNSWNLTDALRLIFEEDTFYNRTLDEGERSIKTMVFFSQMIAFVSVLQDNSLMWRPTGDLDNFRWRQKEDGDKTSDGVYTFCKYENLLQYDEDAYNRWRNNLESSQRESFVPGCIHNREGSRANLLKEVCVEPEKYLLNWNLLEAIHLTEEFARQLGLTELPKDISKFIEVFNTENFRNCTEINKTYQNIIKNEQKSRMDKQFKATILDMIRAEMDDE